MFCIAVKQKIADDKKGMSGLGWCDLQANEVCTVCFLLVIFNMWNSVCLEIKKKINIENFA